MEEKQRIIQEYVPGKQVTLAHIIPSPVPSLYMKLGLVDAEGGNRHLYHYADGSGHDCRRCGF